MATFVYPPLTLDTTGLATEAKQDDIIAELVDVNTELDAQTVLLTSLDGKDFATQATLNALNSKDFSTETTLAALNAKVTAVDTTNLATQATLASVLADTTSIAAEDFATQTTLAAVLADTTSIAAEDFATQTTLAAQAADLSLLEDRLAGSLAPVEHDEVITTYVGATTRISTVTYRLATVTVLTLTFSYDGSDRLTGVVAS